MSNEEYYVGQIFEGSYPDEAAIWCNENNYRMETIQENPFVFQICELPPAPQEVIDSLTMTALDFINFIRSCGLSLADIKEYLSLHEELDVQLTYCQNVYCGVVKAIAPIEYNGVTITDAMIEHAFKVKNGMV